MTMKLVRCFVLTMMNLLWLVLLTGALTTESDNPQSSIQHHQKTALRGLSSIANDLAPKPRIINGHPAQTGRYPYFALMYGSSMCGGVLIGPRLVLSAAHCDGSANEYQIGASSSVMDGESISIQQSIIHPDFNPAQFSGDVMLSILEDSTDKPYLQLEPNPVVGGKVTVIGFGDVDSGPSLDLSSYLQEVELDYIDNDTCDAEHGDFNQVTADMMCATGINKDACFGDSGGPLIVRGGDYMADRLVGIVSWGRGCALVAGVYARISYFFPWIVQTICDIMPDEAPEYMNCSGTFNLLPTTSAPTFTPSASPSFSSSFAASTSTIPLTFSAWSPLGLLGECMGDCDSDNDCQDDLICFKRDATNLTFTVPGCAHPELIDINVDVCVDSNKLR